ncbi:hypothetical protein POM88_006554 [Heracleum sosnowskyi]|uniref:U1-type domain-containing protein n=1 Tax=Heracleum sosnowskyi TaxID=360622 RepID=A0AAD8N5J5_9APIA|nr:hypothetical protein POM88_006554 [Heracleum sosnowskyi]
MMEPLIGDEHVREEALVREEAKVGNKFRRPRTVEEATETFGDNLAFVVPRKKLPLVPDSREDGKDHCLTGNVAPETTKSVEEVADASAINIDQAGQVEIPYQSSVQPNVTSAPQRHMQVARCELCRMDCNSFEILEQHKGGKKHKKNMQKLEVLKAYQPVSNVRSNGQNVDSNSQGKLDPENMQNTEGKKQTILDIITF